MKIRIGLFPKDRDSIMTTNPPSEVELCYLVAKNSNESKWAEKFLPAESVYYYDVSNCKKSIADLSLIDILTQSDMKTVLKANNIEKLYIDIASAEIETWSKENDIEMIVTPYKFRKIFENKIFFDELLAKNNIPKPESHVQSFKEGDITLPFEGRIVIQKALSSGGEGTYFVNNPQDVLNLITSKQLDYNEEYLLRKFVKGKTYGITVFVAPGHIVLSTIRIQCFAENFYPNRNIFLGVQWIPTNAISETIKNNIDKSFSDVGKVLYEQEFIGFANFDFIVDENEDIYLIECNARFSAASVQYLKFHELMGGLDIGNIFLDSVLSKKAFSKEYEISGYPEIDFAGSTLKVIIYPDLLKRPIEIKQEFDLGLYEQDASGVVFKDPDIRNFSSKSDQFIYYTDVELGQVYTKFAEVSRIISSYAFFDFDGQLNSAGKSILNHFMYD